MKSSTSVREPVFPSVVEMLEAAAIGAPEQMALVFGKEHYNYAQYHSCVVSMIDEFADRVEGRRVATILPNSAFACVVMLAVMGSGAQLVPLNPAYTTRELELILGDSDPLVIVVCDSLVDVVSKLAASMGGVRIIPESILTAKMPQWAGRPFRPLRLAVRPEMLAMLQYTGGTTGKPKGVNLTHGSIAFNVSQREGVLPSRLDVERVLCAVPLFHSYGMGMGLFLSLFARGCLIILPRYHPSELLSVVESERATVLLGNPTMYVGLMGHERFSTTDWSAMHRCYSGSAPLPLPVLNRWKESVGSTIYEGYGQTEAGPILSYNPLDRTRPGSVGIALPQTEIEIVDVNTGESVLGVGERGEIRARGPQIMRGYRNQHEATAETLRNGWLHTGDIGEFDSDGYLYIRDRKKDLAIVGGFNVYPREIEDVLFEHPAVSDAAAIGVPDDYRGEVIRAFVMIDRSTRTTADDLLEHCRNNLAKYKVPSSITLLDSLPKTGVNKTDKQALRARCAVEGGGRSQT